jgi:hypothetical protein
MNPLKAQNTIKLTLLLTVISLKISLNAYNYPLPEKVCQF